MSFGMYARQVRDPALPYRRRVSALRSCVQLYRPIGFHASLSFLEELAGPLYRDEAALLAALDILVASRAGWHAAVGEYAAARRRAKRLGQRSPSPTTPNPSNFPLCWYGAPRPAALHAVKRWHRHPATLLECFDPCARDVRACVSDCVAAGGSLTSAQRQRLSSTVHALQRRARSALAAGNDAFYVRTRDLLMIARYVETAADTV
jgi:hypothetical protein